MSATPAAGAEGEDAEPQFDPSKEQTVVDEDGAPIRVGPAALTGVAVGDATAVVDTTTGTERSVSIEFQGEGGRQWETLTGAAACAQPGDPTRRVAIVLDGEVISSPSVGAQIACGVGITGGTTQITGTFTQDQAQDLAALVQGGALPVPVEVIEQRTVGPTLGAAAIDASVQAVLLGVAATAVFIVAVYRLMGLLAVVALLCYGLISYAALLTLGATSPCPASPGSSSRSAWPSTRTSWSTSGRGRSTPSGVGPCAARSPRGSGGRCRPSPTPTSPPCSPPGCSSPSPPARSAASGSP